MMRRQKTAMVIRERVPESLPRRPSVRENVEAALTEILAAPASQGGPQTRPLAANPRSARFKASNSLVKTNSEVEEDSADEALDAFIDTHDSDEEEEEEEEGEGGEDIPPSSDGAISPIIEKDLRITSFDIYTYQ